MCELSLRERHYKDDLYRYPKEELIDYILALEKAYRISEESKQIIFDGYMQTVNNPSPKGEGLVKALID